MTYNYIQIMKESLSKKVTALEKLLSICERQEEALKQNPPSKNIYNAATDEKVKCIKEIEKLDEGFVSVYDRVSEIIKADPVTYREDIKLIQTLIKKVTDLTASIDAKETRINSALKKVSSSMNAEKARNNTSTASSSVAGKYAQTMSGKTSQGSTFINKKQ